MKDKVYWKQKNGVLISIDDMDINHLRNVLKGIIRNNEKIDEYNKQVRLHNAKKSSFKLNGDIANFFNEEQEDSLQNEFYNPNLEPDNLY